MNKLAPLRSRLADLRRRRQAVRWGSALCALVVAIVWALAAWFAVDWLLEPGRAWRVLMLLAAAGGLTWAVRRYVRPHLGLRESEIDLALLVERRQHLDSDLVAALQFESPAAAAWGSAQLAGAVVDYVADFSRSWDVFEGFSSQQLVRRASLLTATLVAAVAAAALFPDHARALLDRLLLGSAHYPTRTQIQLLTVNGQEVHPVGGGAVVKCPSGRPVAFVVRAGGELPPAGRVEVASLASSLTTTVDLAAGSSDSAAVFRGELPKLVDSVEFSVRLGDAWTDPVEIHVIALPVIELQLTATPPSYARGPNDDGEPIVGARQIGVLEGSRVELEIRSLNKPLVEATLSVGDEQYRLAPADQERQRGRRWLLPAENSPLALVDQPIRFTLQATDEDGLTLAEPIAGAIRIKADQKPRVAAQIVTRDVLPTARPRIEYEANDDHGLAHLRLRLDALRDDAQLAPLEPIELIPVGRPLVGERLPAKGRYVLDLAPLRLAKGDRLKITLEAIDERGDRPGEAATSEPLVLNVTDEAGAMSVILKSDERSAQQLDAITNRQLGIGGSP